MPDFDVEARSLASPPVAAPVTTYRPAVRVRNNGIHPADVTGYIRIYRREPPGELLETHQLSLLNLLAGAEGDAQSSAYWTPTTADIGREFLFTAHVDTDHDQKISNNDLSPVTVIVTAGEPPPPPGVLAHATQHEAGGADQVEITGLHGLSADAQTALAHKATHQAGGSDTINVDGLLGTLAQGQPIADHRESHEDGGGDELYVGGLHGELSDNQPAKPHDNARHDPNYSIDPHTATDHDSSVEKTANKNLASGYCGLDVAGYVQQQQLGVNPAASYLLCGNQAFLRPRFAYPNALRCAASVHGDPIECLQNQTKTIFEHTITAGSLSVDSLVQLTGFIWFRGDPLSSPIIHLDVKENGFAYVTDFMLLQLSAPLPVGGILFNMARVELGLVVWDDLGFIRITPQGHAVSSPQHGSAWGDWPTISEINYAPSNSLTVRVRLQTPNFFGANALAAMTELRINGKAVAD